MVQKTGADLTEGSQSNSGGGRSTAMGGGQSLKPSDAIEFMCVEAKRLGAEQFDAVVGESESMGLEIFEGKVKSTEISNSRGIGIRLFKNKSPGFAFTEKMSREAITQTVKDAMEADRAARAGVCGEKRPSAIFSSFAVLRSPRTR